MNTPTLSTARLVLRRFTLEDLPAFHSLLADETVNAFLPWFPAQTRAQAREHLVERYISTYQNPAGLRYAICLREGDTPIGYVNISPAPAYDLGYALQKEHWGKGIALEASCAVVAQAKKQGLPFVTATHDRENLRSGAVMRKLGMSYCYTYKEQWQPKNIPVYFRMYQQNFGAHSSTYMEYWNTYPEHFIEQGL
ncbi:GNAT family N-acetyltransferase [Ruminococcaceae bacterium OttesenSCG-928-N02]|nr:GNAT family N-acetyltransferase [Ruminococcaceae bacterium OttesenSCG-928-N02]